MSMIFGYQSDIINTEELKNEQEIKTIEKKHLSRYLTHIPNQNTYGIINSNIVITRDIRLQISSARLTGWRLSMPRPLIARNERLSGIVFTNKNTSLEYTINTDGKVVFGGDYKGSLKGQILFFNINPYVAEFPVRVTNLIEAFSPIDDVPKT